MTPIIGGLIEAAIRVIEKVIPDPQAKAQAQLELLKLQQAGEFKQIEADLQLALAQTEINKIEATSPDKFVSGWRPAMGWCLVAIFAANYLGVPMLAWLSFAVDIPPPPRLEIGEVIPILLGMLGLGSMRSFDKLKGSA